MTTTYKKKLEIKQLNFVMIKERYDLFLEAKKKMEKELQGQLENNQVLEFLCEYYLRQ